MAEQEFGYANNTRGTGEESDEGQKWKSPKKNALFVVAACQHHTIPKVGTIPICTIVVVAWVERKTILVPTQILAVPLNLNFKFRRSKTFVSSQGRYLFHKKYYQKNSNRAKILLASLDRYLSCEKGNISSTLQRIVTSHMPSQN